MSTPPPSLAAGTETDVERHFASLKEVVHIMRRQYDDLVVDHNQTKAKVEALQRESEMSKLSFTRRMGESDDMRKEVEVLSSTVFKLSLGGMNCKAKQAAGNGTSINMFKDITIEEESGNTVPVPQTGQNEVSIDEYRYSEVEFSNIHSHAELRDVETIIPRKDSMWVGGGSQIGCTLGDSRSKGVEREVLDEPIPPCPKVEGNVCEVVIVFRVVQ